MGTSNGGVITDLPSSASGRSQHQQPKQSPRRPPRACTARTPSRLAPAAPSVERTSSRKQHGRSRPPRSESDPPFTPMVLSSPPSSDQKDRWNLLRMWELSSVVNFLNVFRPVLNMKVEFSIEELEGALLTPNALLDAIHIALLKAIPPISRNPLNHETWVPSLCKKMKDRWCWVAEGSFPLAPNNGEETVTYKELDPDARVVILRALCEARLEQDDIRTFIDEMLKHGSPLSSIRKERIGIDTQGTTYWYENDPVAGQRLYRELRCDNKEKCKDRGRFANPPNPSQWETLATDLDEFSSVAEKLCGSRNRMEIAVGKRINNDIIPDLKELLKKKERALKKQQRQALLLDSSYWNAESITAGRPRRDRKPVSYTFDDYDKSISEAIKITKLGETLPPNFAGPRRRNTSPELPTASERKMSNGSAMQHSQETSADSLDDDAELDISRRVKCVEATHPYKQHDSAIQSSESELSGARQFGRGRRLRKPQRYAQSDFVDPTSDNDAGITSEEDIEGEAVYDDDYVSKKRKLEGESSDEDDEYRGDEDDEEDMDDEDEDDDDYFGSSEEEENGWRRRGMKNMSIGKTRAKTKVMERSQSGLRRSQRATRSHIDYSKYEESDGDDNDKKATRSPEQSDSDEGAATLANAEDMRSLEPRYSQLEQQSETFDEAEECKDTKDLNQDNLFHRTGKRIYDTEDLQDEVLLRPTNGSNNDHLVDLKPNAKVHRFLDLNIAAPMAGGLEDSCSKVYNHSLPIIAEKFENSGEDGSSCGHPKSSLEWPKR